MKTNMKANEMLVGAKLVKETEKAIQVEVLIGDDRKAKIWMPKSQTEISEDGTIWASTWIIDQKEAEVCNGYDGAHIETKIPGENRSTVPAGFKAYGAL